MPAWSLIVSGSRLSCWVYKDHGLWLGRPRSLLSDQLSLAIVKLNEELQASETLWANQDLVHRVLKRAIPPLLQEAVGGIDKILKRLPVAYVKALFGSWLASRFIYSVGVEPGQFAFYEFMSNLN